MSIIKTSAALVDNSNTPTKTLTIRLTATGVYQVVFNGKIIAKTPKSDVLRPLLLAIGS